MCLVWRLVSARVAGVQRTQVTKQDAGCHPAQRPSVRLQDRMEGKHPCALSPLPISHQVNKTKHPTRHYANIYNIYVWMKGCRCLQLVQNIVVYLPVTTPILEQAIEPMSTTTTVLD